MRILGIRGTGGFNIQRAKSRDLAQDVASLELKRGGGVEWGSCFALPAGFELISRESGTVVEAGSLDGWGCSQW